MSKKKTIVPIAAETAALPALTSSPVPLEVKLSKADLANIVSVQISDKIRGDIDHIVKSIADLEKEKDSIHQELNKKLVDRIIASTKKKFNCVLSSVAIDNIKDNITVHDKIIRARLDLDNPNGPFNDKDIGIYILKINTTDEIPQRTQDRLTEIKNEIIVLNNKRYALADELNRTTRPAYIKAQLDMMALKSVHPDGEKIANRIAEAGASIIDIIRNASKTPQLNE